MSAKHQRELDCVLTEDEKNEYGVEAAKKRYRAETLRKEVSELDKASKQLEEKVATGREKRQVDCIEDKVFENNEVVVRRLDDPKFWPEPAKGEEAGVVERRAMTGEERQTLIDGTGTASTSAGGKKKRLKSEGGEGGGKGDLN